MYLFCLEQSGGRYFSDSDIILKYNSNFLFLCTFCLCEVKQLYALNIYFASEV